jgi:ParB family chromosome partitioning protein
MLTVADEKQQKQLLREVIDQGLSVRQTEEMARRIVEEPKTGVRTAGQSATRAKREESAMPTATRALEEDFRRALGTKVQVSRSRKGGKIIVHFYSEEELEAIYSQVVGKR